MTASVVEGPPRLDGADERWTVPAGHVDRFRATRERRRPAQQARTQPVEAATGQLIRRAAGVELLGESEGSGYITPHHLARTRTGRVVQLTRLLSLVAEAAGPDGHSDEQVADAVTARYGKRVTAENVRQLSDKLRGLGLLAAADGTEPVVTEPDPLLALRLRTTLLGPRGVRRLTAPLRPLFFGPVVVLVLAGLVAVDVWLFFVHGLAQATRQTLDQPSFFLLAFGLVVLSAAFHECGHATACAVGGGKPGRMGAGIYLAWPAFYTDVTDAYRLGRPARLRTDLGGVYFSAILVLALTGCYLVSRFEPLLLVAFLMQIEIVHQMLPFLRLDGYYVVSDLVGVPDLFRRTGPVLRSLLPGPTAPAVLELRPRVRWVIRAWVLIVFPILAFNVAMILLNLPHLLATASGSAWRLLGQLSDGPGSAVVAAIQLVFLLVPIVGLGWTFVRLFTSLARRGWAASQGSLLKRTGFLVAVATTVAVLAVAWWPDGRYAPYAPAERGTLVEEAASIRTLGQGSPRLLGANAQPASAPQHTAAPSGSSPSPGTEPTEAPTGSAAPTSPAPSAPTTATPGPGASPSASGSPAPSGLPTPSATATPAP